MRRRMTPIVTLLFGWTALGATLRVPQDHRTIQAAIDAARPGDTVLVSPGTYPECIRLAPSIVLRSEGDDTAEGEGLKRAAKTIIDGGGKEAKQPGVVMAEGATLDGFTVTRVGEYDDAVWKKHFDSHGEELGDDEGAMHAEGTLAAIAIQGVSATVTRCIVHHNGDVGIGITGRNGTVTAPSVTNNVAFRNMGGGIGIAEGAEAIVRGNICRENLRAGIGCRKASPIIIANRCYGNVRAGIGCREGARAIIRGNECYENRRAGIGVRMEGTAPLVEGNTCRDNAMAGTGCRDHASPILRGNICRDNQLAGIGCRDGARPLIVGNECRKNGAAGIGVEDKSSVVLHGNTCIDNATVAIGVINESEATITGNVLSRSGGQPPLVVVKDHSTATIVDNRISGGGVAAILLQGNATITRNALTSAANGQGNGVWAWEGSTGTVADNVIEGFKSAINAGKASLVTGDNVIREAMGAPK